MPIMRQCSVTKTALIYAFVCRALVATVRPCTVEELTSMVLECGRTAVGAMELLDRANTATYGHP